MWENVDECLNWYQNLCGADENDTKWDAMKYKCKRALGLLKKKDEGDFIDDDNDERRRFILSPNAKVDNITLLVLNEISGDNDMAIAAVRVRAGGNFSVKDLRRTTTRTLKGSLNAYLRNTDGRRRYRTVEGV